MRRNRAGFTLIELMMVVAIVGVLAALAVYGVRHYRMHALIAEAQNNLGQIGKDAESAYQRESMPGAVLAPTGSSGAGQCLCTSATYPVPRNYTGYGRKHQSSPDEWSFDAATPGKGFACLHFSVTDPQYWQLAYLTFGTGPCQPGGYFIAEGLYDEDSPADTDHHTMHMRGYIQPDGALFVQPTFRWVSNPL